MFNEILVHGNSIFIFSKMYPIRFQIHHTVTLLKEQNVRSDFRSGIRLKCCVWQTHRSQKLRPLCQVFSDGRTFLIHGSLRSNYRYNSAWPYFIQRFCQKIVMD